MTFKNDSCLIFIFFRILCLEGSDFIWIIVISLLVFSPDIDECASSELNLCENKAGCINTNGSFLCSCEVGNKWDNDGRSCVGQFYILI